MQKRFIFPTILIFIALIIIVGAENAFAGNPNTNDFRGTLSLGKGNAGTINIVSLSGVCDEKLTDINVKGEIFIPVLDAIYCIDNRKINYDLTIKLFNADKTTGNLIAQKTFKVTPDHRNCIKVNFNEILSGINFSSAAEEKNSIKIFAEATITRYSLDWTARIKSPNKIIDLSSCGVTPPDSCYHDRDCGEDSCNSWSNYYCEGNDLFKKRTCTEHVCSHHQCDSNQDKEKELIKTCEFGCSNNQCNAPPNTESCTDGIKNRDETDIDCGGSKCPKCGNNKVCTKNSDCQTNYCNPSINKCENPPIICQDECSQGSTKCLGNIKQTCGNFDSDSCLEWGNDMNCPSDCSNNQCNPVPENKPDLTVPFFIVQYPSTSTIQADSMFVLGFIIKNEGTADARNVFWRLTYPDCLCSTQENKEPLFIPAGKSNTIFVMGRQRLPGTSAIKITVDPDNKISELNENNNEKELVLQIV